MANVKTAISIEQPLFEEVEALAAEMEISRSRLFALAAREFIRQNNSRKLLNAVDNAFRDAPDPVEEALRGQMKSKQRRLVENQW